MLVVDNRGDEEPACGLLRFSGSQLCGIRLTVCFLPFLRFGWAREGLHTVSCFLCLHSLLYARGLSGIFGEVDWTDASPGQHGGHTAFGACINTFPCNISTVHFADRRAGMLAQRGAQRSGG